MKMIEDSDSNSCFNSTDAVASETQSIHSPSVWFSPTDEVSGGLRDDNTQYIEDTLPLDDVHLFGDEFDTQILDLDGQTQVLNPFGETQVLDEWNNVVSINSEDEECGKTEYLGETQVLSDNDSMKSGCDNLLVVRGTPDNTGIKKDINRDAETGIDVMSKAKCSGSMVRGFTSLRAASLRTSGLAARNTALSRINTNPLSTNIDNSLPRRTPDKNTCPQENSVNQQNIREDCVPMNQSRFTKVGSSTVRKLFTEDKVSHMKQADDGLCSFAFESGLGGLGYLNSEEPGELSQANALEVVDKFLEHNVTGGNSDVVLKKSTVRKGKLSSAAIGMKSLAKKSTTRSTVALSGAYYWDDNREDEGGGEFFQKKKYIFFSNCDKKHATKKEKKPFKKTRDKESDTERNLNTELPSDARLMSNNLRANRRSLSQTMTRSWKNLIKNMDEQMENTSDDGKMDNGTDKIVSNIVDVGCDMQMAADSMENLRAIGVNDNDHENRDDADKRSNTMPNLFANRVLTRHSKKARTCAENQTGSCLTSSKQTKNTKKLSNKQIAEKQPMNANAGSKDLGRKAHRITTKMTEKTGEDQVRVTRNSFKADEKRIISSTDPKAFVKRAALEQPTPVAYRTRKYLQSSCVTSGKAKIRTKAGTLSDKEESCKSDPNKAWKLENLNSGHLGKPSTEISSYPTRRRIRSELPSIGQEVSNQANRMSKRLKTYDSKNHPSAFEVKRTPSCVSKVEETMSGIQLSKIRDGANTKNPSKRDGIVVGVEASPKDSGSPSVSESENTASPVCMGDEYRKQSCRKNLKRPTLKKEINSLIATIPTPASPIKGTRKRKDLVSVRVIFSRHLDQDISKQQKKILTRLGASEASSISDASHFVTDVFVRTRNMLEAIAYGKPVVTHLWLESCALASCFIDESSYILRDDRKEKELGFNMPFSLDCACRNPILKGQRVLITPNTKPGKEVLISLVKAIHGLVVERLERSSLTDEKRANDILVLSCEQDYEMCIPFLEKGASIYSSELLLNGIVTQRLDYQRYCLVADIVKRTRSTLRMKRNEQFGPTCKGK